MEVNEAANYIPPVRYGCSSYGRYGGMTITDTHKDVWDVLHELVQAHKILSDHYNRQIPGDKHEQGSPGLPLRS